MELQFSEKKKKKKVGFQTQVVIFILSQSG